MWNYLINILLISCVFFFVYHIYHLIVKINTTSTPLKITSVEKYKEIIKELSKQTEEQRFQQKYTVGTAAATERIQLPLLEDGGNVGNGDNIINENEVDDTTDTESVCSVGYLHLKHEMQDELRKLVREKNI